MVKKMKASSKLVNSLRLIGTIIEPFKKMKRGTYSIFMTKIEVSSQDTSRQLIPLTFYIRPKDQVFDYTTDLTGKQVVIEGYVQGNEFTKPDSNVINYLYIVVREIAVLSNRDSEKVSANGVIINDDDLPF